jgi:Flp pilus assembly pilin Flp
MLLETLKSLWNGDSGQDLTEYALLLVLAALVAIASRSMLVVGRAVSHIFSDAVVNLTT